MYVLYFDVRYPPDSLPSRGFCQNLPWVENPYSTPLMACPKCPSNWNKMTTNTAYDTFIIVGLALKN